MGGAGFRLPPPTRARQRVRPADTGPGPSLAPLWLSWSARVGRKRREETHAAVMGLNTDLSASSARRHREPPWRPTARSPS